MQLLHRWAASLSLFQPQQIKLFIVAFFRTLFTTYTVWLPYFWWLVVIYVGLLMWYMPPALSALLLVFGFFDGIVAEYLSLPLIATSLLLSVLALTLFAAARPSVTPKTYAYFLSFYHHALWIGMWFIVIAIVWWMFFGISLLGLLGWFWLGVMLMILFFALLVLIPSITVFFILFLYDTDGSHAHAWDSLRQAWWAAINNFPLCAVAALSLGIFYLVSMSIIGCVTELFGCTTNTPLYYGLMNGFKVLVFMPIIVSGATTVYTQRIRESV